MGRYRGSRFARLHPNGAVNCPYPLNEREIALVNDGRVDILDLTTMTVVQSFATAQLAEPEAFPEIR